jgi:pantetheine-phosphate adenylyltransferase
MKTTTAIYPGSFDPLTNGHLDLICRASTIFDKIILGIANEKYKSYLFTLDERLEMAEYIKKQVPNLEIHSFEGLLVNFVRQEKVNVVIRGLRAFSDFEYEFQMALTNRKLSEDIETLFLMPAEQCSYISSSLVREIARLGGDVSDLVPPFVVKYLKKKIRDKAES